jgi:membrane protein YqaA with SNARE-associated domain
MHTTLTSVLDSYGYVILFLLVALESLGLPLPGETALVTAAAFAAAGHLSIAGVVATAAVAAMVGDHGGYWLGREGGLRFVRRYGRRLHLRETEIARAHAFFARHGAKTVFVGRFIALLRTWAAVLANPPVIEQIAEDPVLRQTGLIAEAWDAAGLYQVGHFSTGAAGRNGTASSATTCAASSRATPAWSPPWRPAWSAALISTKPAAGRIRA